MKRQWDVTVEYFGHFSSAGRNLFFCIRFLPGFFHLAAIAMISWVSADDNKEQVFSSSEKKL